MRSFALKSLWLSLLITGQTLAASHPYLGGFLGETITGYTSQRVGLTQADVRNYQFGGRLFAGWQWREELAIETGVWALRALRLKSINGTTTSANVRQAVVDVVLKASYPLPHHYTASARMGVGYYRAKPDPTLRAISTNDYARERVAHFRPVMGLGLSYAVSDRWSVDAHWLHILSHRALPAVDGIFLGGTYRFNKGL